MTDMNFKKLGGTGHRYHLRTKNIFTIYLFKERRHIREAAKISFFSEESTKAIIRPPRLSGQKNGNKIKEKTLKKKIVFFP